MNRGSKRPFCGSASLFGALALFVAVLVGVGPKLKTEFFPAQDNGRIAVKIKLPISDEDLNEENIIAPALDKRVAQVVAEAVVKAAKETGVARI